jgi:hypothetical protein
MRSLTTAALGASLLATAVFASAPVQAGGMGVIATGGTHQERFYAYDLSDTERIQNTYIYDQMRPNYGFGLQGILGDRDDNFVGTAKFWYQSDAGQTDEGIGENAVSEDGSTAKDAEGELVYKHRQASRGIGLATAGVQWRLWGEPMGFQLSAITNVGAAFMTSDSSEFLLVQVGPGAHYTLNKRLQVNAEVVYELRYRKSLRHGASGVVGVRYLFD